MWRRILERGLHVGRVVLCKPISEACIEICLICLSLTEEERGFFSSEILVSSRIHISEYMVSGVDRPMQLLKDEVDQLRGLAVYIREGFSVYKQQSYECGCCEIIVVIICSSGHNFYVFAEYRHPNLSDKVFGCF